ncbi:hypothetical protein N7G274_004915 [Stereocaulon virgatum]|uniref:cyclin-dependent kinase n=1 Tax=Stereocaulon virgatum TaxID=373712 RepID=A0ABR4ABI5_9LECA
MKSPSTWQPAIGFSDRMAITLKIATSFKTAFPESDTSQSQAEARGIESSIYKDASSKEDYYQRCYARIDQLNRLTGDLDEQRPLPTRDPAEQSQKTGQVIGPYPNCTHYTTGLYSTIYKTRLTNSPQTLALKLTMPSQCQPPHNPKREARIITAAKHPNIIPLLETHTLPSSHLLLVFPFQPLDLATLLLEHQPLRTQQAKSIIHDLFSALARLHSLGVIHRDIKPSNILLSSISTPSTAYLADFGIAWSKSDPASEPPTQKITDIGTTSYRPPELLFGRQNYSYEIDLWAAGCVVAEIVEGRGHDWALFDAGELGSELALVKSIFETLGTPDEEVWPEAKELPDWGKMTFVEFPGKDWGQILPNASAKGRDLVGQLVRYQSSERLSAEEVLKHAFLQGDK